LSDTLLNFRIFCRTVSERSLSEEIMRAYRRVVREFFQYFKYRHPDQITSQQILGWHDALLKSKKRPRLVLAGTRQLFEKFYQSKLTEEVRGQLTSRIALHYLLPELTQDETKAVLRHAFGSDVTDEMIEHIHQVTGENFRGVDMIIPRILELKECNRQKLDDGTVKMK
jgi:site-specific recombinase XerD